MVLLLSLIHIIVITSLTIVGRASERKFSKGYKGRYRASKSYWAPKALSGPLSLNHFCWMGVNLHFSLALDSSFNLEPNTGIHVIVI